MKIMLGRMRATVGYANHPGPPCVERGNVVVVTEATNMPASSCIDAFVHRVDNPGNSIGVTWGEIDLFEGITGCNVCEVCDDLCDDVLCSDCRQQAAECERNKRGG